MAIRKKPVDVVCIGFGMTSSIAAQELTDEGLDVVALERGQWRNTDPDFAYPQIMDELKYGIRHELQQDLSQSTLTFRNKPNQTALPMRHLGSFLLGTGVGGAMVHWNGQTWRGMPDDFRYRSWAVERYGEDFLPDDMTIQDWGVSYEELEPHYHRFELLCGISGQAGYVNGEFQEGGNPFSGDRSAPFPLPPLKRVHATNLFDEAAKKVGMHPFPVPAANASAPYTNLYGVRMGGCTFCGFCERFGCYNNSKASPQACIHPALMPKPNFELRTGCHVTKILLSDDGKRATGVLYVDPDGREVEQPAELVICGAYAVHNVQLLLNSGIGEAYDPKTGRGNVGRNYAYQTMGSVDVYFDDQIMDPFVGAGALGQAVSDWQTAAFDHSEHGFLGGAYLCTWQTGGRPINQTRTPESAGKWGSRWKQAVAKSYNSSLSISSHGSSMSYKDCYLDLDPTYTDAFGQPLLRMTFDFHDNDLKMSKFTVDKAHEIATAMSPKPAQIEKNVREGPYDIVPYQTTHNTGGAIMGDDPATSVVNKYMQVWDVPNLFVPGASAFPQNFGVNPTSTLGALTYLMIDGIRSRYLNAPGLLV
ncbi:GMC family oxidoreductase [uncultured Abyssibacter sp.]|uniref:GMC family oxidoreductase n=1 Tax=uncultured Abyssibacter sp. TaxID=2320202 RepID=UPI0032B12A79